MMGEGEDGDDERDGITIMILVSGIAMWRCFTPGTALRVYICSFQNSPNRDRLSPVRSLSTSLHQQPYQQPSAQQHSH